jgi:hypothetical protein
VRRGGLSLWLACSLLSLASCGSRQASVATPPAAGTTLAYEATLQRDLSALDVKLCFRGAMFGGLTAGRAEAMTRLRGLRWLAPEPQALTQVGGRIPIAPAQRAGCLAYTVDLREGGSLSALVTRVGDNLVASPNVWLLRPLLRPLSLSAKLVLNLPEGLRASLPFAPLDLEGKLYALPDSVFAFDSHAAFGPFVEHVVDEAGVRAHAALLGHFSAIDPRAIDSWLRGAVRIASGSDGRFPAPALHVLVLPGGGGDEPFGSVARGGGASVLLFVPDSFDAGRLSRDWVLPHELSHLLLPFVKHEDAWLAEGLATYYQEVLRARAGVIPAQEALANIAQALRSAQREGTGRSLCDESRAMHQTHAYRAVYWGGAAALLLADVALRKESAGKLTLDGLLTRIRREDRMTPEYGARELLARMDALSGSQTFSALAARCEVEPFPDFEATLRALGADATESAPEGAELSAIRAQIFAPQAFSK